MAVIANICKSNKVKLTGTGKGFRLRKGKKELELKRSGKTQDAIVLEVVNFVFG